MATDVLSFSDLSDNDLLAAVHRLAVDEQRATAKLIASLAELDARRLYLAEGYSSLFTYCTQVLHLSEHAAYGRIEAARVTRKYPVAFERLEAGDITLATIGLLAPHLTPDNYQHLLEAARHKSTREIEHLVATLRPQPCVPSTVRKLPDRISERPSVCIEAVLANQPLRPVAGEASRAEPTTMQLKAKPAIVQPLGAERYKVQFTVAKETFEKLRRVQDLMRHTCPSGDASVIFDRALTMLLQHLERTKVAQVSRPQPQRVTGSAPRHIPATVRREVWARDNGQCAFIGARGAARNAASSSFITSYRLRMEARPSLRIFNCDVEPTTNMSRICGSRQRSHYLYGSCATIRAGSARSGPSRRSSHVWQLILGSEPIARSLTAHISNSQLPKEA